MSINPFSLPNLLLLMISICLLAYFIFLWRYATHQVSSGNATLSKPAKRFAWVYAAYLVLLCLLATTGFFLVNTMPPRFLLVFLPLVLMVIFLSGSTVKHALSFLYFLPPVSLILVHVYRLFIELLFIQFADEKIIPVELSVHGRNYDLWIGVLALPVGFLFLKGYKTARVTGIVFNVLGLLSLVNIFSIVIPSVPSSFRQYDTLYLPTYFPGVTIVFLASAAIFLHILSLKQLLAIKKAVLLKKEETGPENIALV